MIKNLFNQNFTRMKKMLLLGLVAASMASCSNNEVIDANEAISRSISFDTFVNKATRAGNDVVLTSLKEFYVFGYYGTTETTEVFNNVSVVGSQSDPVNGSWTVGKQVLWDTQVYKFAAYANGNGDGTKDDSDKLSKVQFQNEVLTITEYDTDGTKDLIVANSTTRDNTEEFNQNAVDLSFSHLLSRIAITFKNASGPDLSVDIEDIILTVKNKGTYTTDAWNLSGQNVENKEYTIATITDLGQGESSSAVVFYLTPQQLGDTEKISFTAIFKDSEGNEIESEPYVIKLNKGKVNATLLNTWDKGIAYSYTINLPSTPKYINFNVQDVIGWGTAQTVTISGKADRESNP